MRNDCQHHETQMGIRLESWELDPKWVLYDFVKAPANEEKYNQPRSKLALDSFRLGQITNILNRHQHINFTHYKPSTLSRRIHRRCLITGYHDIDDYPSFVTFVRE